MKCNERCLELRLGDQCGRCGGLVDVKKPADGLSPSQRLMLGESMRRLEPRLMTQAELDAEPGAWDRYRAAWDRYARSRDQAIELASMIKPERCCGMVDAHGGPGCSHCPMGTRPIGSEPRFTDQAIADLDAELGDPADLEDLDEELALANLQLAHDVVASMSEGPKPRAADDADAIQKAMREIHDRERRRPIACAPGQHDFRWEDGVYTCRHCLRGKREDGR